MPKLKEYGSFCLFLLVVWAAVSCGKFPSQSGLLDRLVYGNQKAPSDPKFNYVIGTQSIGVQYQFTNESKNIETSRIIKAMGSKILKVNLNNMQSSDLETILTMDFDSYLFWYNGAEKWTDGMTEVEQDRLYHEIFRLGEQLLTAASGRNPRDYYLGHWEGDWQLLQGFDGNKDAGPLETQGMIDWLNIRQKAVDDLRVKYQTSPSKIFHYTEVNRVMDALERGKLRMVNTVLPYVDVDYISYSAYDIQQKPQAEVNRVLDYVASRLKPRPEINHKRILVTEMGFSADVMGYNQKEHERRNREFLLKFINWGSPMVLYWQIYNNEIKNGKHRGFWLIDDQNKKWPLYETFRETLLQGADYVQQVYQESGSLPLDQEYQQWLVGFLRDFLPEHQ